MLVSLVADERRIWVTGSMSGDWKRDLTNQRASLRLY